MIELRALCSPMTAYDGTMAISDLSTAEWEPAPAFKGLDDPIEIAIESAFDILASRIAFFRGTGYPFTLNGHSRTLTYAADPAPVPYLFLLGLSYTNPTVNYRGKTGAALFEELAFVSIRRLVGDPAPAVSAAIAKDFHFSALPGGFPAKVQTVANAIKEGRSHKPLPSGRTPASGDRGVDLLIRRGFPDPRGSQLLVFGSCAAGNDWHSKRSECDPANWTTLNFQDDTFSKHGMAKCCFLPRVVPRDRWPDMAKSAGVVVDRCRMAMLLSAGDDPAIAHCADWLSDAGLNVPTTDSVVAA
jgi:hypothetical protein